ncbi:MAG: hypothetical protein QXH26_00465 [Candidatus Hadarchaeales archaeon]
MGIVPRKRRKRHPLQDVKRGVVLFLLFLGLSTITHETFHLLAGRFLGYHPEVFYGVGFPNVYGYVKLDRPCESPLHKLIVFSAGGIGTAVVLLALWSALEDIVAKLLLSFFTLTQLAYGILEPLYAWDVLGVEWLGVIPLLVGILALVTFRLVYARLGWW